MKSKSNAKQDRNACNNLLNIFGGERIEKDDTSKSELKKKKWFVGERKPKAAGNKKGTCI